jgi:hypothetical protein
MFKANPRRRKRKTLSSALCAVSCLLIFACVPIVHAGSLDPRIVVGDPSTGAAVNSATFSFHSDAHGGGSLTFVNDSGETWTTLDFFVTLPSADTITCASSWYGFCDYTETSLGNGQSQFDIGFEQPFQTGILPGSAFSLDLNDPGEPAGADKGSWGPFTKVDAVANFDIPEPAALYLVLAGLIFSAVIATYRRTSA